MAIDELNALPPHPLGVRPLGNAYADAGSGADNGLRSLPDELLVKILEYLDAKSLARLGATCKSLFAFSRLEDLWKSFYITSPWKSFEWRGSWYASFILPQRSKLANVRCDNLFSDLLYRPFHCAHINPSQFAATVPPSNEIPRLATLSAADFRSSWTQRPFVLTDAVTAWPVYRDWSREELLTKYRDAVFRAEAVEWPLHTYAAYMDGNTDESPLYLFDRAFVEKTGLTVGEGGDYWPPPCYGEDLFAALGEHRPDNRWLIVGPARAGSTFHKDPNATSAWNAVIRGAKYWIMFPPHQRPPGVYVSRDQSEVTSPLSIAEWLLGFHAEARRQPGCLEGICRAGEVLHVPSGWWHLAANLEGSIAITQNFVPRSQLVQALAFLKDKPDQVSGFADDVKDPYALFVERLGKSHPELLAEALRKMEQAQLGKKRKWEEIVEKRDEEPVERNGEPNGFSFGFEESDASDS